jgi:hypothetical protein
MKLIISCVVLVGAFQMEHSAPACEAILTREGGGAVIAKSGRHCLEKDMLIDSTYFPFRHGSNYRSSDRIGLLLAADDIVVDLSQHTITSNGILIDGIESPTSFWQNFPDAPVPITPKNISIRNGTLRMTARAERAIGIKILTTPDLPTNVVSDVIGSWKWLGSYTGSPSQLARAERWVQEIHNILPGRFSDYVQRNVHIENMSMRTAGTAIAVEGAGTIIRNSTIEVDAGTAIWIYGPNAIIENNTIVVNGSGLLLEADAPIRLYQGDGAIIRNNRIVVKGRANRLAVSTFRTGRFKLENNLIFGVDAESGLAKAFLGTLDAQLVNNEARAGWRAIFDRRPFATP